MGDLKKTAAALLLLCLMAMNFAVGWVVNGWRLSAQIESLKHEQTKSQLSSVKTVAQDLSETQGRFVDALQQFQSTQQENQLSQQDLNRVLLDLRAVNSGLRGDFADLPERIKRANQASLGQYATTCTAVFEDLAREIGTLAEDGAAVARAAEGHAADVKLMQDAWKK